MSYKEPKPLNDVAQFHKTFKLPICEAPVIPDKDRCDLRISLLEEELEELKAAIEQKDIVEIADAFCDLQYVLSGAIHEFGLGKKFCNLFEEVQRSNMSKPCETLEEAEATKEYYATERGMDSVIEHRDEKYFVYRKADGKVFKSVNYFPPDLKSIIKDSNNK